jgi:ABC-2 type transport system ATP-binding protein
MRRRALIPVAVVALVAAGTGGYIASRGGTLGVREEVLRVTTVPEADGTPVTLDATLYLPDVSTPEPAVILAHGFGGSKADEAADALFLAQHGYVALAYSARGFGASGGQIHLDSPQYEVRDAQKLVDLLGTLPQVLKDSPNDPRVGITGPSYGGALALLAAGYDKRIDAIAPMITWNDLGRALFGQSAQAATAPTGTTPAATTPITTPGVFKKAWAGDFFSAGATPGAVSGCGRFAPDVCAGYEATAAGDGTPNASLLGLLAASSPARILNRITAPTLLIQGETDSLFGLDQADANARGIAAHGTPVKTVWYSGGHDAAGTTDVNELRAQTLLWFDRYLKHDGSADAASPAFQFAETGTGLSVTNGKAIDSIFAAPAYATTRTAAVRLAGPAQTVVAPAGGYPAAITSLPGLGGALATLGSADTQLGTVLNGGPGQQAVFTSAPLGTSVTAVGAATVTLHVTSSAPDATLFAKLYDTSADGGQTVLPQELVAPIRLTNLPAGGVNVRVALPAIVHNFSAGDRLSLVVATTDQAYQLPADPRTYQIALTDGVLRVPLVDASVVAARGTALFVALGAVLAAALLALGWYLARRRRNAIDAATDPDLRDVPVAISGLGKAYGDGFRAVSDLSFRVEPGQVLGLLGPNGAGKTTALRMLVGLIRPTEGEIRVFGHRITAGAPVLSRVGAFIEGPGFLPHLSGLDNLTLYWGATGRPTEDADIDAALELAGLGIDIHRKVRTYSQGMRQRLAVAQAMLGLPDLLVLDEPTNGLDPPQIREMREALGRYAATGRTVVVSSHLLAEVEQTCTHCVVMHRGRLVAAGPVTELVGATTSVGMDVDDPERAVTVLTTLPGVSAVATPDGRIALDLTGVRPAEAVRALVGAGLAVDRVAPRHRLEDVFLDLVQEG